MNGDKVSDCSSDLVCDGDTLRYLHKIHRTDRKLMIFHFKYHSVTFILENEKGPK